MEFVKERKKAPGWNAVEPSQVAELSVSRKRQAGLVDRTNVDKGLYGADSTEG